MDTLHDATNAFALTLTPAYARTIDLLQRQRNSCVDVHAADGVLQVRPTTGNLVGDRFVPSAFALTYRRPITRYTARRFARSRVARRMLGKLPWLKDVPSVIDISTVAFADDIRSSTLWKSTCSPPAKLKDSLPSASKKHTTFPKN